MSNEQNNRILHHSVAVELTNEMIEEVSGGTSGRNCTGTTIIYSTDSGSACNLDSDCDC